VPVVSVSVTQLHSTGTFGQALVVMAGVVGVALIATIGMRMAGGPAASAASRGGHATAAVNPLARLRDTVARRSHPIVAAGVSLAAGLALAVIIICTVGLLTKVGVVVHLDRQLGRFVDAHRVAPMTRLMLSATLLGSYPVVYTIAIVGGLIVAVLSYRLLPLLALVAAVPTETLVQKFATRVVHGTKPAHALAIGSPGGFFSGGSARTLIVCGLLAYFLGWLGLARQQRALLWTCVALATFIEGYSRLYLGRHWAVDIVGGWVAGALILGTFVFSAEALRRGPGPGHAAGRRRHAHDSAVSRSARRVWTGEDAFAGQDGPVSRSWEP